MDVDIMTWSVGLGGTKCREVWYFDAVYHDKVRISW